MKCKDGNLLRDVAIKVLHSRGNPADLAEEVAALSSIQSKHVVQIFDVVIDDKNNVVALIQEYLAGDDLTNFNGINASLDQYLKVIFQIAAGIADIHASGRIHRDIKPENMRFDDAGIIKVFDFGLSSTRKGNPATVAARGTHGYRAPELYPFGGNFDASVDVYAFGVVAWTLAGGMFPNELLEMPPQSTGGVPSISTHPLGIPAEICKAIDSTLRTSPASRPTMATVRDVISRRLLYGKHKATVTSGSKQYDLTKPGASIIISGTHGVVEIAYSGLEFKIKSFNGDVYINGVPVKIGDILPDSCVIIIGAPPQGANREFLPFNSSHPEVIL